MAVNSPENRKRVADMERKLEEHDKTEAAKTSMAARRYNPREACRRSTESLVVNDETLGEVHFGVLSISEFADLRLSEVKDENARIRKVIHAMLKKADPDLTLQDVEAIGGPVGADVAAARFFTASEANVGEWISANADAQTIGLIAHEFNIPLEQIGNLTTFQFCFLREWLKWWWSECQK